MLSVVGDAAGKYDAHVHARIQDAVTLAMAETRANRLSTVQMVIALKELYESLPPVSAGADVQRRAVFDRLLSSCIIAWFTEDAV